MSHGICIQERFLLAMAVGCLALALSAAPAVAQATYQYTGNTFNQFSCGPFIDGGVVTGTLNCSTPGPNDNTSYTNTDRVTATLAFDDPLPANLDLEDVRTRPGFSLTLRDGHQTLTTPVGFALISTNGSGQITSWRLIINLGNAANSGIATQNWFNTATGTNVMADMGTLACCHPDVAGDFGAVRNNPGTWTSGTPTPEQLLTSLITVVQEMQIPQQGSSLVDQLQKVLSDVQSQNGQACLDLAGFVNHVRAQTGKKITLHQAQQLQSAAAEIGTALECGS